MIEPKEYLYYYCCVWKRESETDCNPSPIELEAPNSRVSDLNLEKQKTKSKNKIQQEREENPWIKQLKSNVILFSLYTRQVSFSCNRTQTLTLT